MTAETTRPSGGTLVISEHTVTKTGPSALIEVEAEKMLRGRAIGEDSGLFYVPEVLDFDAESGRLVMERVPRLRSIFQSTMEGSCNTSDYEQIGRALAIIHADLTVPEALRSPLPRPFEGWPHQACLHGDFNPVNICRRDDVGDLVILDWQTTHLHGGEATLGPRWFDLIWFADFFLWTPTVRHLLSDPFDAVFTGFFGAYFRAAPAEVCSSAFVRFAHVFFDFKRPHRWSQTHWRRRHLVWRAPPLTRRFLEQVEALVLRHGR